MLICGKEVDFKISRLKDAGNFEMALEEMKTKEEEIKEYKGPMTGLIEKCINMFRDFFKKATGTDVLEACEDMDEAKNAYFKFLDEIKKQKTEVLGITVADIK